ncbi:hypothetical protein [Paludibaculum fermentans]|uniref:Uncharacterized protein n=1 Tax=Paludibaculum fermentans TaxID=1473598 RepID=A0A7S7NTA1_PALFE|nr:hypothetical protein [Paludibaculum fermentans]QOY89314.1 hypothetical protein IRI77_04980 [Paludibaculum fermentans]
MEQRTVGRAKNGRFLKAGEPVAEAVAPVAVKPVEEAQKTPRKRRFRAKQMRQLMDRMLVQFAEQVEDESMSFSVNDAFKLIQLRESVEPEKPSSVKVEWVERKDK